MMLLVHLLPLFSRHKYRLPYCFTCTIIIAENDCWHGSSLTTEQQFSLSKRDGLEIPEFSVEYCNRDVYDTEDLLKTAVVR